MASPNHSMLFLCFSFLPFLFFHSCSALPFNPHDAFSLVDQICGQTKDVKFCQSTFNSNPRATTANLKTLCFIILKISYANATDNEAYIAELLNNTKDRAVKQGLHHCTINYLGSVIALEESFYDLKDSYYKGVQKNSRIAYQNSRDCEHALIKGPAHQSPSMSRNNELIQLTEIINIIIVMLLKSM